MALNFYCVLVDGFVYGQEGVLSILRITDNVLNRPTGGSTTQVPNLNAYSSVIQMCKTLKVSPDLMIGRII